jgi:hypothetical protein
MVPFIAHIELKCIMVAIKEDNWQCENFQYNEYCLSPTWKTLTTKAEV